MKRCAIYTRKSSNEGLEQDFNSLDAQREACEAYAKSQVGEGWMLLEDRFDDGGFSGGSMERPALKRLLTEVAAGRIDVVIVYKIDRLTRSLPDFARIVEAFDDKGVSFVSVTQAFNTTSSMGRLTLNVLLSFAQFEREVTGERIRDKIAASKAKGMWMGGVPPLGYDPPIDSERRLRVNDAEAETVRHIFERYLQLCSVPKLHGELNAQGISPKLRRTSTGRAIGADRFSRTAIFHLLRNPIYIGKIRHKDELHDGRHDAIVDPELFARCQRLLSRCAQQRKRRTKSNAPLTGKLFNDKGAKLTPTHSANGSGQRYRYYARIGSDAGRMDGIQRVSGPAVERFVRAALLRIGVSQLSNAALQRVELTSNRTRLSIAASYRRKIESVLRCDEYIEPSSEEAQTICWSLPARWTTKAQIESGDTSAARHDETLIRALRKAHGWLDHDRQGLPGLNRLPRKGYERRILKLAFLAPDIQAMIIAGRQPVGLTLEKLVRAAPPHDWSVQREWIRQLAARSC